MRYSNDARSCGHSNTAQVITVLFAANRAEYDRQTGGQTDSWSSVWETSVSKSSLAGAAAAWHCNTAFTIPFLSLCIGTCIWWEVARMPLSHPPIRHLHRFLTSSPLLHTPLHPLKPASDANSSPASTTACSSVSYQAAQQHSRCTARVLERHTSYCMLHTARGADLAFFPVFDRGAAC
ncbi:hypothetical protein N431DRAFT_427593 [Stipitochalara longipes BDJ]|nr:hypothetical protein N431DRAFT_427593 [Stipitochalara longipes BDJ]